MLGVVENMAGLAQPLSSFRLMDSNGQDATQQVSQALRQAGLQPEVLHLLSSQCKSLHSN